MVGKRRVLKDGDSTNVSRESPYKNVHQVLPSCQTIIQIEAYEPEDDEQMILKLMTLRMTSK